jgi:hypothetical protein
MSPPINPLDPVTPGEIRAFEVLAQEAPTLEDVAGAARELLDSIVAGGDRALLYAVLGQMCLLRDEARRGR